MKTEKLKNIKIKFILLFYLVKIEMMAERRGTPTAQTYPIMTMSSGVAPSKSELSGSVWFVELLLPGTGSYPKTNGGRVIKTTPEIMNKVIRDL